MTTAATTLPTNRWVDLSLMLNQAARGLELRLAAALAEIDSSPRIQCVLAHALEAERTQAQLAEIADLDKTTMTVTVDLLEQAGLAERRLSATDRRARIVVVTLAGQEKARQGLEIVQRVHGEVLGGLAEAERTALLGALGRLAEEASAPAAEGEPRVRRRRAKS